MDTGVINIDPEILGGTPVFSGTRVPVKNLFDYLESGESINYFLDDFDGVQREQVIKVLEMSQRFIASSSNLLHKILLDECVTKRLKSHLTEHEVTTVREMNWGGVKNGKLMTLCVENGFEMLLTIDKNLQYHKT